MEETNNPYLALRAAKIARNEARLKELGLWRPRTTRAPPQVQARRPKKVTPLHTKKKESPPLRRSSRHSNRPATYLELPPEPKRRKQTDDAQGERTESTAVTPAQEEVKTFPPHSARAMDIHVEKLVLAGLLGNMMDKTGKAYVMEEAAIRSGLEVSNISFNKYSGVQEWQNDALFLWVNLGNGGDVVNDFLNGGRQVRHIALSCLATRPSPSAIRTLIHLLADFLVWRKPHARRDKGDSPTASRRKVCRRWDELLLRWYRSLVSQV